jgi:phosphoglycerate dehydrogenase-like enzyme
MMITVGLSVGAAHVRPLFGDEAELLRHVDGVEVVLPSQLHRREASVDVLVTGWGSPPFTDIDLARMPALRAILHAAGSVKGVLPDASAWQRGLLVTSAAVANAEPVAEFTASLILLAEKRYWSMARAYSAAPELAHDLDQRVGNYGSTVGLVGLSRIGRRVADRLESTGIRLIAFDPTVAPDDPRWQRIGRRSLLELAAESDVVSLHAPLLPGTSGMIDRHFLAAMRDDATIINTARGGLIDEAALLAELGTGRLTALLDVTVEEPLPLDHPLRSLPNVVITPHLAGAQGNEVRRLGAQVTAELVRLRDGLPPIDPIRLADLDLIA